MSYFLKNCTRALITFFLVTILISCTSESEKKLRFAIDNDKFDFTDLPLGVDNIHFAHKGNIQFGLIDLLNGQQIKFWFLTHHCTSDIGGTIYEFPNGDKEFYSGLHCCEVQFFEKNFKSLKFRDADDFRAYVKERNGIKP